MSKIKDPEDIKIKFGRMPCFTCGYEVVVRIKPKTSTLSYHCSGCEDAGYAQPTKREQYAIWLSKITIEKEADNTPLIDTSNKQEKQAVKVEVKTKQNVEQKQESSAVLDMWGNQV